MYNNFFGFRERPFKLVPDPDYLFLSKSHEVALAHLTYAVSHGDGFVEITGEVGTGKTTLCRAFLEHLDDKAKAAYIFNPKLNSIQLLKAINDEFGISSEADNTKDLIDTLNSFLIEEKSKGTNIILVIDEAQTLENGVLEQIRLLSNLETTKHKLLQIVLVGQPELEERLDSSTLRQLGQRITLSSRLIPLSYKEVVQYIQHRIDIASERPDVQFSKNACKAIFRYSNGIPRLINMACDRALISAYVLEQKKITGKTAKTAIKELSGKDLLKSSGFTSRQSVLVLSVLCLAGLMILLYPIDLLNMRASRKSPESTTVSPAVPEPSNPSNYSAAYPDTIAVEPTLTEQESATALTPADSSNPTRTANTRAAPSVEPVENLSALLVAMDHRPSRHQALEVVMKLWDADSTIDPSHRLVDDDDVFFNRSAQANRLLVRRIYCNIDTLKRLNFPAILAFPVPNVATPRYLSVIKIENHAVTLSGGEARPNIVVHADDLNSYWPGKAYILWENFIPLTGTIPLSYTDDGVVALKKLMQQIGFREITITPFYDNDTRKAVEMIQRQYGIQVDGIVGPTTKIALYSARRFDRMPRITDPTTARKADGVSFRPVLENTKAH